MLVLPAKVIYEETYGCILGSCPELKTAPLLLVERALGSKSLETLFTGGAGVGIPTISMPLLKEIGHHYAPMSMFSGGSRYHKRIEVGFSTFKAKDGVKLSDWKLKSTLAADSEGVFVCPAALTNAEYHADFLPDTSRCPGWTIKTWEELGEEL